MEFGTFALLALATAWILVALATGFTFYVYSEVKDEIATDNKNYLLAGSVTAASSAGVMLLAVVAAFFFSGSKKVDGKEMLKNSLDKQKMSDQMMMESMKRSPMMSDDEIMPRRSTNTGWCRPKSLSIRNMETIYIVVLLLN